MSNIEQCKLRISGLTATFEEYANIIANNLPRPVGIKGSMQQAFDNVWREIVHYQNVLHQLETEHE